jgi:hypothetical protein
VIPSQSDLFSSDDGTAIKAIPSMSLTYPKQKGKKLIGSDKIGSEYIITIEDTDLIHSKSKKKGYRVHFKKSSTILSFITFDGNDIETIVARLKKIGYVFIN